MMKSYITCLYTAIDLILLDAIDAFPTIRKELERDRSRFSSLLKTRGLPVLTLDLPALGKHFDLCLSNGTYETSGLPLSGTSSTSVTIPKLFSGMLLRVFQPCGMLWSEPCIDSIAFLRQLYAIGKKVKIDCEERKVYETLDDFYKVDASLPDPTLSWDRSSSDTIRNRCADLHFSKYKSHSLLRRKLERGRGCISSKASSRGRESKRRSNKADALDILQQVADNVSCTLGVFDPFEYKPKHGPGAVSDGSKENYKYDFPAWSEELEGSFPQADFAFANYSHWVESGGLKTTVPTSKLVIVPKTQKGPRLIAAEPTAHQWCQQILRKYFDERVHATWLSNSIAFHDQTKNQDAALEASKKQSHWTVDLSAASDRVSCRFVERLFRKNPDLLAALVATRTPNLYQQISENHPSIYSLKKYTTMGSACTFPVESIGFLVVALAAMCFTHDVEVNTRNLERFSKDVCVFGDDIIIPSDAGRTMELLLSHLDFEVNQTKTHRSGRFRESCGMEAYDGVDVTPAYILQVPVLDKPKSIASVVASSNNFYVRGWWRVASYLQDNVNQLRKILVVAHDSGAFGYVTFGPTPPYLGKRRWNEEWQLEEVLVTTIKVTVPRIRTEGDSVFLQYFTEEPAQDLPWQSGLNGRSRIKLRREWVDITSIGLTDTRC